MMQTSTRHLPPFQPLPSNAQATADALAEFLIARDWPNATPRSIHVTHGPEYRRMAAAIINGEAWAIRKAWPEAADEIKTRDWRP